MSLRRHLKRANVYTARATKIDHANKTVYIRYPNKEEDRFTYDILVVTTGAVTKTFPVPGLAETAVGLKRIEEAMWIRNKIIDNFNIASTIQSKQERKRLLTFCVVGGGFAGVELLAEIASLCGSLLADYPTISRSEVEIHLVEAAPNIMPEVSKETSLWVIKNLTERGATIHLNTQCSSTVDGRVLLSSGDSFETDCIVWTAGCAPNPLIRESSDLPCGERGHVTVNAYLQVVDGEKVIPDVWACGDVAAVPNLLSNAPANTPGCYYPPNAQNAIRQGKRLAGNICAQLSGRELTEYVHNNLGAVAGLGLGVGVFQAGNKSVPAIKGLAAWLIHRAYHGTAIPTTERKIRIFVNFLLQTVLGRDFVSLSGTQNPKRFFSTFATPSVAKQDKSEPQSIR